MLRLLLFAALSCFAFAPNITSAQSDDPPKPLPMLFPAGIDIPYDPTDPWPGPDGAPPDNRAACAHWENDGLQLTRFRDELWVFFNPQDGHVFCGIPIPYPYPDDPLDIGAVGSSSPGPSFSTAEGPAVSLVGFTVRSLSALSAAELARAQDEGIIPHQRRVDGGYVLGFPAAPITIVLFSDYACPYCQVYEEEIVAPIIEEYVATGRARLEYRFFPTVDYQTGGKHSKLAACVGELAGERFWAGHTYLYQRAARGRLFSYNTGQLLADEMGLDYQRLKQCTESVTQVAIDTALGQAAGVSGTPMISFRYATEDRALTAAQPALSLEALSAIIKKAPHR
ncbi:MAG: thioredoxin domain-containing protein [Chloroflexi bacterium]|nr:thioredoxin domain-containing protein [Chloroflexota bacterium]